MNKGGALYREESKTQCKVREGEGQGRRGGSCIV